MGNRRRFETILFDCFNTVFVAEGSRMPLTIVDGKPTPSTAGILADELRPRHPGITAEAVYRAHREAWSWAESERGEEFREVPAMTRFRRMLGLLGVDGLSERDAERLLDCHADAVTGSYRLPPAHAALLERLAGRRRLALFSNFDYAPALRRLLRRHGLESRFDPVAISAEIGWRKPGRRAFDYVLARMGRPRAEVLCVGDSLADDVAGAAAAGVPVAWLNPEGEYPAEGARPDFVIRELVEDERLIGD
jgi:putative hydrolase of the HAD superfamily